MINNKICYKIIIYKMLNLKKIILFLLSLMLFTSNAIARCDFGIKLGDEYPEKFYKYGGYPTIIRKEEMEDLTSDKHGEYLRFVFIEAPDICESNTLKDIGIEFTFLNNELASIRMIAMNDEKNTPTNKLILMKYAKSNYGKFDTGFDEQTFNNFYHWRKNKSLIIYDRTLDRDNIWNETIYITNKKYEEQLIVALSDEYEPLAKEKND